MRNLSNSLSRLAAMRSAGIMGDTSPVPGRLTRLAEFGSNPGALRAHVYAPASLRAGAALVVVLHGCTQTAAGYDTGAGWSEMADRRGFALLFPEQQRSNNQSLCFNWFVPEDSRRGSGEALSIHQMVETAVRMYRIDPERVFITGLSAGGAMASIMLATYPEMFAGGAILAGLPYGTAGTIPQAFDRMRGHGVPGEAALAALVRSASDHRGPWPTISVWHGSGDATVNPDIADAIVGQWRSLHQVGTAPSRTDIVDGYPRRVWCDATAREVIEEYSVTGMGHGTPLDTAGLDGCGKAGAYMLEASISSTRHICRFWGLTASENGATQASLGGQRSEDRSLVPAPRLREEGRTPSPPHAERLRVEPPRKAEGVGRVIEDAFRAAGLMR